MFSVALKQLSWRRNLCVLFLDTWSCVTSAALEILGKCFFPVLVLSDIYTYIFIYTALLLKSLFKILNYICEPFPKIHVFSLKLCIVHSVTYCWFFVVLPLNRKYLHLQYVLCVAGELWKQCCFQSPVRSSAVRLTGLVLIQTFLNRWSRPKTLVLGPPAKASAIATY